MKLIHAILIVMIQIKKTSASDKDFASLVRDLDAELAVVDGEDHAFYDQFNKIGNIRNAIVLYYQDQPIGCGALKEFDTEAMEIKRMYIKQGYRGRGLASKILSNLENWALELNYKKCVLETGKRQKEAVILYKKRGYTEIPNYGPYIGVENSLCFEKIL